MKTPGAIRHKLNQVRFRYLSRYLEDNLKQVPCNCRFNASLPPNTLVKDPPNLCLFGANDPNAWKASYCDERVDQGARAKGCPFFQPVVSKEELKSSFMEDLTQMRLSDVAYHYPDMAALLWVLDAEDISEDESEYPEAIVEPLDTEQPQVEVVDSEQSEEGTPVVQVVETIPVETPKTQPWYSRWLA